jgi:hypothetical protein
MVRVGDGGEAGPERRHVSCLNCGTDLGGPFCHLCGQRDRDPAPPVRELIGEFLEVAWNWDSRLLQTLRNMLLRPGLVVQDYNAGRRARHVSPLRLFLVTSAAFLALVTIWGQIEGGRMAAQVAGDSGLGDAWPHMVRGMGWTMFLLVPGMAGLLKVAYLRSGRPYVHHLIFSVQYHTLIFLYFGLLLGGYLVGGGRWLMWAGTLGAMYVLLWPVPALRRAYGSSWLGSTGKAMGVVWVHLTMVVPFASTAAAFLLAGLMGLLG